MSVTLKQQVQQLAVDILDTLVEIRRDLHQNPELGLQETRTAKIVANTLRSLGAEVQEGFFETGVVGLIKGNHPGKTILIRADMDALPVQELGGCAYKSTIDGKMHACGHDAHTTWLLGVAMIASQLKDQLHGNIKLMFQPAEECPGGAHEMIQHGILQNPTVSMAMGAHVTPNILAGEYILDDGAVTANPDFFRLTLQGKGAHGSTPEDSIDPINMGVQVYNLLQSFIPRTQTAHDPVVLSVCMFNSGTARGIIPDSCELQGTVRSFKPETRAQAKAFIEDSAKAVTQLYGGSYDFSYEALSFPVQNDAALTQQVREHTAELCGPQAVITGYPKFLGGEDYCFIAKEVPSTFVFVGCKNDAKFKAMPLHNPYFDIDEDILAKTAAMLAYNAICLLQD